MYAFITLQGKYVVFSPEFCSDSATIIYLCLLKTKQTKQKKKSAGTTCLVIIQSLQIERHHITKFVSKIHYSVTVN